MAISTDGRVREAVGLAPALTPREREIAVLIAQGCSNQQIAEELVLTTGTVANHVGHMLTRLGAGSRAEIAAWAVEHGLGVRQDRLLTTLERLLHIQATTLAGALNEVATLIAQALGTEKVDAFLHEPPTDTLVAVGASDTPLARKQRSLGLDRQPVANGGRAVEIFQTGRPYLTGRADQDSAELRGNTQGMGVRSSVGVAPEVGGVRRGVLVATSTRPDSFSERDLRFLEAVSRWVGDVAHRAELIEQLTTQAAEQARRAAADELVAILAHDLRNYLTPLGARLQLLGRRAQQDERGRDLRDLAAAQAVLDRLQRLIADLLDSARLEQGIFQLSPEPLNLAVLARDVVRDLAVPEVPVRVQGTDELVVTADPRRLRQALENLLANAIRHSPEGGAVEVELAAERREGGAWAVLSVADQGPGIPPEVRPRLFQRFSAGPGSVGLGLGLYLAQRITAAHGGTLTADPSTRRGARFVVSLPSENHELAAEA